MFHAQQNVNRFREVVPQAGRASAGLLNKAGEFCKSTARRLAPVDTGLLQSLIELIEKATPVKLIAVLESGATYSVWVNFGNSEKAASPYFSAAAESTKGFIRSQAQSLHLFR